MANSVKTEDRVSISTTDYSMGHCDCSTETETFQSLHNSTGGYISSEPLSQY